MAKGRGDVVFPDRQKDRQKPRTSSPTAHCHHSFRVYLSHSLFKMDDMSVARLMRGNMPVCATSATDSLLNINEAVGKEWAETITPNWHVFGEARANAVNARLLQRQRTHEGPKDPDEHQGNSDWVSSITKATTTRNLQPDPPFSVCSLGLRQGSETQMSWELDVGISWAGNGTRFEVFELKSRPFLTYLEVRKQLIFFILLAKHYQDWKSSFFYYLLCIIPEYLDMDRNSMQMVVNIRCGCNSCEG